MESINLDDLLKLTCEDVIPRICIGKVGERIALALKKRETPWALMKLAKNFSNRWLCSAEASKVLSRSRTHTPEKMKSLEQRGYLTSAEVKLEPLGRGGTLVNRLFRLTKKAINVMEAPSSLPSLFLQTRFSKNHINRLESQSIAENHMNRAIVLFTGGKESVFSLITAESKGCSISELAILEKPGFSVHKANLPSVKAVAKMLGKD